MEENKDCGGCSGCGDSQSGKKSELFTGSFTSYDPEKGIFCEGNFEDGVMNGPYVEFVSEEGSENKVLLEGGFLRGMRQGKWIQYNEDKTVKNVKVYVDGKLIEENK